MTPEAQHHHDGLARACGLDPTQIVFCPVAIELLEGASEPCRVEVAETECGLADIIITTLQLDGRIIARAVAEG